jgi:hypothetical protein
VAGDEELGHGLGSFAIWDWASRLASSRSWSTMIFDQLLEAHLRLPAQLAAGLGGVADQQLDLAGRS